MTSLIVLQDCSTIQLSRGMKALIDADDFIALSESKWWANRGRKKRPTFYAARATHLGVNKFGMELMHRVLMGKPDGMDVDHRNLDTLDNRRSNLRICTRAQNIANTVFRSRSMTSKYRGVSWEKRCNNWLAVIVVRGKRKQLGNFEDEKDAARAYDKIASETYGDFYRSNAEKFGDL